MTYVVGTYRLTASRRRGNLGETQTSGTHMYEAAFVKHTDRYSGRGAGIIWELSRSEGFGHPGAFTSTGSAALPHRMTANSAAAKRVQCGADRLHSRATPSPGYTVAALHRRQQLASFAASTITARSALRAMFVNSRRLTGDHAEQPAEIFHKTTPNLG